jgi:aminocarboxymuconate-semialdehyde decarboxylase
MRAARGSTAFPAGAFIVESRPVTGPAAIDVHAHFFPEEFLRLVEQEGAPFGAGVDRSGARGPVLFAGGSRTPPLDPRYHDLARRLRAMDGQGVGVQALSLTVPMIYWADGPLGGRLARAFNDAIGAAHTAYPDRFVGCAILPMQDAALALEELGRVARLPGIRAVYMGTNVNGRELSHPDFFPLLERCQALGLPVLLHPIRVIGAERLAPFYLHNLLGNPFDTAVAAAQLVFGGVLDRLPRLRLCLPHAGGALPYLAGRLQRGQRVRPEARTAARRPFTTYLRRFTYDTISHAPRALRFLIETVGADRVVLGSDFCFDMGYERPRDIIQRQLRLSRPDRERILRGNASRLLGLA